MKGKKTMKRSEMWGEIEEEWRVREREREGETERQTEMETETIRYAET